jgi:hypothetical protein
VAELLDGARWAHFTPVENLRKIAVQAMRDPQVEKADALAALLNLTDSERNYLRITTIGASDITRAERFRRRKQKKRERDRQRAAMRRREQGMVPRSVYLESSLSALRP